MVLIRVIMKSLRVWWSCDSVAWIIYISRIPDGVLHMENIKEILSIKTKKFQENQLASLFKLKREKLG